MKIYERFSEENADNYNFIEYKDFFIVFEQEFNIYDSNYELIKSGLPTEEDAYQFIDSYSKETKIASDEEVDSFNNKEYVVCKHWKYNGRYVYSFYKGEGGPSNNVRYYEDDIRRGSQKDVPSFSISQAKGFVRKFNSISLDNGYPANWEYKEKWW